jgi:hypothetical protein
VVPDIVRQSVVNDPEEGIWNVHVGVVSLLGDGGAVTIGVGTASAGANGRARKAARVSVPIESIRRASERLRGT